MLGGTAEVVPGVDFPIVQGRIDAGAQRTVLVHSMYDTTPGRAGLGRSAIRCSAYEL